MPLNPTNPPITTVQIHIQLQMLIQTQANTGGLCFRYERFINFLKSAHCNMRRETRFLLCWPHPNARRILWCLRSQFISAGWDPKNLTTAVMVENSTLCLNGRNSTLSPWSNLNWFFFKILKFSGPSLPSIMSSTLQPHFLSGGLLWQWWLSYPLCARVKLQPMTMHLNS